MELNAYRDVSGAPTPISLREIQAYMDEHLITSPSMRLMFVELVRVQEDEWLAHVRQSMSREIKKRSKDGDPTSDNRRKRR